jgi:DNA-binding NarL/FixJ family response regulator
MTVRVVLADDHALVRSALQMIIADTADVEVVGEAGTGAEAVRLAETLHPDVVVMDIRMPGVDGIEATRLITARTDGPRVVVLTTFDDDDYVYGALRAGASGFLVKDMALEDILAAIRVVAAGDSLIAPSVTRRLIGEFVRRPEPAAPSRPLNAITARERDVLTLVGPRHVQHRDRRPPAHHDDHGQDVREPAADQAGRPRPRPAGDHRVRGRPRDDAVAHRALATRAGRTRRPGACRGPLGRPNR